MIQHLKKFFLFFSSRLFYFILGLSFIFIVYTVHAVNTGDPLTAALWNNLDAAAHTLGSSYLGTCYAAPNSTCKCNTGEIIMLMTGNSAGNTGYCNVVGQGSSAVYGACDAPSVSGSYFSCFK